MSMRRSPCDEAEARDGEDALERQRRLLWEQNMMADVATNREMMVEMRKDLDRLVEKLLT